MRFVIWLHVKQRFYLRIRRGAAVCKPQSDCREPINPPGTRSMRARNQLYNPKTPWFCAQLRCTIQPRIESFGCIVQASFASFREQTRVPHLGFDAGGSAPGLRGTACITIHLQIFSSFRCSATQSAAPHRNWLLPDAACCSGLNAPQSGATNPACSGCWQRAGSESQNWRCAGSASLDKPKSTNFAGSPLPAANIWFAQAALAFRAQRREILSAVGCALAQPAKMCGRALPGC